MGNKNRSCVHEQSQDFRIVYLVEVDNPGRVAHSRRAFHDDSEYLGYPDISFKRGFDRQTELGEPRHIWVQSMAFWYEANSRSFRMAGETRNNRREREWAVSRFEYQYR